MLLGEMFPDSKLTPLPGDEDRAAFIFWLNVMATSGYVTSGRVGHPERFACSEKAAMEVAEAGLRDFDAFFDKMENAIAGAPFFMAGGITPLDFYVSNLIEWHPNREALFKSRTSLARLYKAVAASASYQAALETHAMPAL